MDQQDCDSLIDEEAEKALQFAISSQPQLMPLEQMAPALFNRFGEPINGKHSIELVDGIIRHKGFAQSKYRAGFCHTPDEQDPLSVARNANANALQDPYHATYPQNAILHGVFNCTHLVNGLTMQKTGKVVVPSTNRLLLPDQGNAAHKTALSHGLLMLIFPFAMVKKHQSLFDSLMASMNLESDLTLPGDEVSILLQLKRCWAQALEGGIVPKPGQKLDDAVLAKVRKYTSLSDYSSIDLAACFDLSKTAPIEALNFIRQFQKLVANPLHFGVPPSKLQQVAQVYPKLIWVRVGLLAAEYAADRTKFGKEVTSSGGRLLSQVLSAANFENFDAWELTELETVEKSICEVVEQYWMKALHADVQARDVLLFWERGYSTRFFLNPGIL